MIIVSQGKGEIINFDNINLIGTDAEGAIRARLGIEDNVHLGAYATEERAEEVLQEIVDIYEHMKYLQTFQNRLMEFEKEPNFVYEMPEN